MSNSLEAIEVNKITLDGKLELECGQDIENIDLVYETYGTLNSDASNAILICHALSGNHHAAGIYQNEERPGWWDALIGPEKAINTNKFFVVCPNNIGGCHGSTGPSSINKQTGKSYGPDFPIITVADWVRCQSMLSDSLGIKVWHAVIGGSLGGMQALQWSISYPDYVLKAGIFAAAAKSSTQNIALNEVAREAIRKDPNFLNGEYIAKGVKPKDGIKTARMLGHITYLSEENMDLRFGRKFQDADSKISGEVDFEVENYLQYKGEKFSESFDANSYIIMTKAMDNYDFAKDDDTLSKSVKNIKASLLIIGFYSDWLYPPERGKEIQVAAIRENINSSYIVLEGEQGHDSFLFKTEKYEEAIKKFID